MYRCPPHVPLLFVSVWREQPLLQQIKLIIHLRGAFSSSRKQNKYLLSHRVTKEMSQQCKEDRRWKQDRSDTSSLLSVKEMKHSRERTASGVITPPHVGWPFQCNLIVWVRTIQIDTLGRGFAGSWRQNWAGEQEKKSETFNSRPQEMLANEGTIGKAVFRFFNGRERKTWRDWTQTTVKIYTTRKLWKPDSHHWTHTLTHTALAGKRV